MLPGRPVPVDLADVPAARGRSPAGRAIVSATGTLLFGVLPLACLLAGCGGRVAVPSRTCEQIEAETGPLLNSDWSQFSTATGWSGNWTGARMWIERQLVSHDDWTALGWCEFRQGNIDRAAVAFEVALSRVRHSSEASTGLGYVALRRGSPGEAVIRFSAALRYAPAAKDAIEGLTLALQRLPSGDASAPTALETARSLVQQRAGDRDAQYLVAMADRRSGGSGEIRLKPDADSTQLEYFARAGDDYLELRDKGGAWQPLFVKGVNLGPAQPGHFASEAPEDEATWSGWLDMIAGLGANTIRVYTLQPPAFYRALAAHNARPDARRLWLLQGVWAELPPDNDFDDPAYITWFQSEIARVIDAVHGDLIMEPERGTARGIYDTDVSGETLAWIVGREWEPFAVAAYEQRQPGACSHPGQFVEVASGRAMECWIGSMLDYAAAYEARRDGQARPLTFANWPTLDPLVHPTEATRAEEDRLRHERTGAPLPDRKDPAWDDDAVSVDATLMSGSANFAPGVFASYHIYPNFPYFMNLDPAYAKVQDEGGINRYAGYLRALKAYHGHQPVLVAEFGMSTSRGIAHVQPDGLNHGGHDEAEAMHDSARLLRTINREGMAGGVAFEFMDEWFKGTWSTSPFEVPEEHRPRWFNAESPEQSYGLFANRPAGPIRVDGDPRDWAQLPDLASAPAEGGSWTQVESLRATYDAGWVYILVRTAGRGPIDWSRVAYSIGLDTYAAGRGERILPAPASCQSPTGIEFAVSLRGPGKSELLVTPPYVERHPAETGASLPLVSPLEPTGQYARQALETNRERYARDGTVFPAKRVMPGLLRFGSLDPASAAFNTLTDVAVGDDGTIELRLPWALLNFADPSTGQVLHNPVASGSFKTVTTDRIDLQVCAADLTHAGTTTQLPAAGAPPASLRLKDWVMPDFILEPKYGIEQVRNAFGDIADRPALQDRVRTDDSP
jgi:tetratricopeptide (TPR) repeat protein